MTFSQSKHTYKMFFQIYYKDFERFESLFQLHDALAISIVEISSKHIEAASDDIWEFSALFANKIDEVFIKAVCNYALEFNLALKSDIKIESIDDQDWLADYQTNLKPVIIGNFFIAARSKKIDCPADKMGIFIDASRAFGTGEHQSTISCINAIEYLKNKDINYVLDIGTGSGILSFACERLWPGAVIHGCDIEPIAIDIAKDNACFNDSKVIFYQNNEADICLEYYSNIKQDLIVANILANPLIHLAPNIGQLLTNQGYVILAGFLIDQEQTILTTYKFFGFNLIKRFKNNDNNWLTLLLKIKEN